MEISEEELLEFLVPKESGKAVMGIEEVKEVDEEEFEETPEKNNISSKNSLSASIKYPSMKPKPKDTDSLNFPHKIEVIHPSPTLSLNQTMKYGSKLPSKPSQQVIFPSFFHLDLIPVNPTTNLSKLKV